MADLRGSLGAASDYVTVWGASPIHGNDGPTGPLVAPAAFDLSEPEDVELSRAKAELVPKVAMPLPKAVPETLAGPDPELPETIAVALLHFEPRFEVASDSW